MTDFKLDQLLQRVDDNVMETELEGNVVLLHIELGKYYSFNASSSDLWRWLALPVGLDDLATKLHHKYHCSEEQARQDSVVFVEQLLGLKLVQPVD